MPSGQPGAGAGRAPEPCSFYQCEREERSRKLVRIVVDSSEKAHNEIENTIKTIFNEYEEFAYAVDGYVTVNDVRYDAIISGAKTGFSPQSTFQMAIPYKWKNESEYTIYRPKISIWDKCEDFDMNRTIELFWEGVDSHDKSKLSWGQHSDMSI
jgi:hypothetical protein